MQDLIDKKIADRIRKLLAKARGTENEAEAMAFLDRATSMLQEHNVTESDIGGEDAVEPLIERIRKSVDWNPWRIDLIQSLCGLYFSKIYITRYIDDGKLRRGIMLVGRPHNLDIAESMFEYLEKTTKRLAKESYKDRKLVLDFEKGCGSRLASRIRAMTVKASVPAIENSGSGLPALYKSELQLADDMVQMATGGRVARGGGHRTGSSATAAGRNAADSVNLGAQIGGRSGARMLGAK